MQEQPHRPPADSHLVHIETNGVVVEGELAVPRAARAVVVLAQASGSSRHAPRSRIVAQALREDVNVGTLLVDLFSPREELVDVRTAKLRFDIPFLAKRLGAVADWLDDLHARGLPLGLFAASNAAAAALAVAARRPDRVDVVMSRNGRPDLASDEDLDVLSVPTLFLVGGADPTAIAQHERVARRLRCRYTVEVIPGASHVFDEPGKLGEVARRAGRWLAHELDVLEGSPPRAASDVRPPGT